MPAPPGLGQSGPGGTTAGGTNPGTGTGSSGTGSTGAGAGVGPGPGTYGGGGSTRGGGQANPVAAAMMTGGRIAQTGNPANPFGEMTGRQRGQIAGHLTRAMDSDIAGAAIHNLPFVGTVVRGLQESGLVPDFHNPVSTAVADAFGEGTISGLFGNYSADPAINQAVQARFDARRASLPAPGNPEGYGRNGLMPSEEEEVVEENPYALYTPTRRLLGSEYAPQSA